MQINPPFGYREVVPLQKNQKVRLLAPGEVPEFARTQNALPVSFSEFQVVAREYPIVFSSGDGGKSFAPVAVLGMKNGENLYCDGTRWTSGSYLPAYARRFPFCMARVAVNKVEQKNRIICIEKAWQDDAGEAMFDAQGAPLEKWTQIERLLSEYEADLERSRELCALLSDYGLLEPFAMQASLTKGGSLQLAGMHRVAEKKLEELNANQLKNLIRKGVLARAYLHLASLDNFRQLLERKSARS